MLPNTNKNNLKLITPVKPIDSFSTRWENIIKQIKFKAKNHVINNINKGELSSYQLLNPHESRIHSPSARSSARY